MKKTACLTLLAFSTACSMYKSTFDCPPGEGIGCRPVTELLDMIVEKEKGEDLFIRNREASSSLKQEMKKKVTASVDEKEKKLYLFKEHDDGKAVLVEYEAPPS